MFRLRSRLIFQAAALLIAACFAPCAAGESAKVSDRPKVGLVLAGGGALGFAHVGVLRVLEEYRIPVHIVTGTSMGAIVGSAYSAGVALQEMERLLTQTDWDALFSEKPERSEVPYRYKAGRDRELYGDARLNIKGGELQLPTGAVQGQNVLLLLQNMLGGVRSPVRFDDLPIPFRAVAADLETGHAFIPSEGDLATIVRASMSVPGFFAPVEVYGKLLVDGGIANNTPVDVALAMGADVLIVVELYADLKTREKLGSATAISGQIISLLLAQNSALQRQLMRDKDVLLEPELKGYSATDFAKGKELMALGEAAARRRLDLLRKLSVSESEYERYKMTRTAPAQVNDKVNVIKVQNDSVVPNETILDLLGVHENEPFDRGRVEQGVSKIYSMGRFQEVRYETVDSSEGKEITVYVKKKPWFEDFFRIGAAIEDDLDGQSSYRLGVHHRLNLSSRTDSFIDFEAEIGKNPRLLAELYQPLGADTPFFVSPSLELEHSNLLLRSSGDVVAEYERLTGVSQLLFGREISSLGEAAIGVRRGFGDLEKSIGDNTLPEFGYDIGETVAAVRLDALDTPDFPTSGYAFRLSQTSSLETLGAGDEYHDITGRLAKAYSWGRNTISYSGDFGLTFNDRPVERSFSLGGFLDISGFAPNSLLASDFHVQRLMYYRRFSELKMPLFGFGFFAGGSLEYADLRSDIAAVPDERNIWAGSIFVGADTPLLPTYFGVGLGDGDEFSFYLAIGRLGAKRR